MGKTFKKKKQQDGSNKSVAADHCLKKTSAMEKLKRRKRPEL